MTCPSCGGKNREGAKFCEGCGSPLERACPACATPLSPTARYCSECGASAAPAATGPPGAGGAGPIVQGSNGPTAERRLVSVLFADLVGFTSMSEPADPEDVRGLLSSYFDTCTGLIERYGGVVEKFIGDAVMALWGAPVAQEDDAERAVRTALDLTQAVALLGEELGRPGLSLRAGVATGEAAVNLAARGQGMVAGDLVNTASRIQSEAAPGSVLVSDVTRRATEAAISYREAGTRALKGKDEPVQLYEAVRVVAGVGGLMKSEGLEPPFVGRDRELRMVKDLFHATAEEGKAHLVQVSGIAGIGKSRLSWELFKYLDGLKSICYWHRGRCLSYGEGVTYWALAEMVRGRAGILEGEDRASALEKLHATVVEHVVDEEERRFVEPRLAQLVGLEERTSSDKTEIFSAWRLFFERLGETYPVVMVFEDMQWADPSLVEFIDHVLDFSRNRPIFVMTLSRPDSDATETRRRNVTSIYLEPLDPLSMGKLLDGFVPGVPAELRSKILERAEGVPLYLVETVRMLLDKGLLVREGPVYRPVGEIATLEIPETLHALVASRLDQMPIEERLLVQDAAVLGKSFTRQALSALTGDGDPDLERLLASLVTKEVFSIQLDPRSPERGQYAFVQDLMRTVAYETLSRPDRRAKHLSAAGYLQRAWGQDEEEIVEVVASHLLSAYLLDERAPDAAEIRETARLMLIRAGERAASLLAAEEAEGYFDKAASLADSPLQQAELTERAGQMAEVRARMEEAVGRYERATSLFTAAGEDHAAARCQARLAGVEFSMGGYLERAIDRMLRAQAAMEGAEPDPELAAVEAQLGRLLAIAGRYDESAPHLEQALQLAEYLALPEVFSQALSSKAILLITRNRNDEGATLLRRALEVALANDLSVAALRAYNNLAVVSLSEDRLPEALDDTQRQRELASRVGDRPWELRAIVGSLPVLVALGRWDEAVARAEDLLGAEEFASMNPMMAEAIELAAVHVHRGELAETERLLEYLASLAESDNPEEAAAYSLASGLRARAAGDLERAFAHALDGLAWRDTLALPHPTVRRALVLAVEVALDRSDLDRADELLGTVQTALPGEVSPWLRAQAARLAALLAGARDEDDVVEPGFVAAESILRNLSFEFDLAVSQLEHSEWLSRHEGAEGAGPLVAEAAATFRRLRAAPWVERTERAGLSLASRGARI